jgi:hypothetical protein
MKWFRFYSEVLEDEKVQTLSVDLRWSWVCILCLANEGEPRGTLPPLKRIAFRMRVPEKKAQTVIDALITERLLDQSEDGSLKPHNWDERQRKSDNVSERVNKHRNAHKNSSNVTLQVTKNGVTGNGILSARAELDSDSDSEPPNPLGGNGVCVSTNGSEPEPYDPNGHDAPDIFTTPRTIGVNSPGEVRKVLDASRELCPGGELDDLMIHWLASHRSGHLIAKFGSAKGKGAPRGWLISALGHPEAKPTGTPSASKDRHQPEPESVKATPEERSAYGRIKRAEIPE